MQCDVNQTYAVRIEDAWKAYDFDQVTKLQREAAVNVQEPISFCGYNFKAYSSVN